MTDYYRGKPIEKREDAPKGMLYFQSAKFLKFQSLPTVKAKPIPYFDPETVDEDGDKGYGWVQQKGKRLDD